MKFSFILKNYPRLKQSLWGGHNYVYYSETAHHYRERLNEDYTAYVEANGRGHNYELRLWLYLLRNHTMAGVFREMDAIGFPTEVVEAIKESVQQLKSPHGCEKGEEAHLVILDENNDIPDVLAGGRKIHRKEKL